MTQTWWLSFADDRGFLGVAIVDVTPEDAADAEEFYREKHGREGLVVGDMPEYATYIGAAIQVSHAMGCNPGGEVKTMRIDTAEKFAEMDANGTLPRNRVLSLADLQRLGHMNEEVQR